MKNMKRLLAVLLAVLMCLSCLAGLSFADKAKDEVPARETELPEGRGFKSMKFRESNVYQYADDEIVDAIVLLKGAAPAELPEAQRAAAATRVAAQHNTLRNALRNAKISYAEEFEYDSLLNGLCISVAYGDLDKIAALSSVKAVYIANHYAAPVVTPNTRMASSNEMTGAAAFQTAGYKGEGMVVAVLDTGITPDHEAFQVYGDTLADAAITKDDAEAFIADKGYGTYLSQKIPFSFDYYDQDNDATDDKSGHGTHVSGIAVGYAQTEEGEVTFTGTAPFAQLIAMKVFSSGEENGTNSGIYFAALEDCYELGVDVINMSLGAQNGNTYDQELEDEVFGNIYQTLEENGIILAAAAGNEYSMAEYASNWAGAGYVTSDYADYGVVGTPSTYDGNMSVASAENAEYPAYVIEAGERQIAYNDPDGTRFAETFGGQTDLEYVVIDGFGAPADFAGVDIEGKIALISRGDITFQEKIDNAADAGAIAAIVYNNQAGVIGMAVENIKIPACSITQEDGQYLISLAEMPEEETPAPGENETPIVPIEGGNNAGAMRKVAVVNDEAEEVTEDQKAYYWDEELKDGDEIVMTFEYISEEEIYAVSTTANGTALAPVVVEMEVTEDYDYIVYADPAECAFTVSMNDEDGTFKLISKDGKYLTSAETGNGLSLTDEPNDYSLWELEKVTSEEEGETYVDGYYFKNVNAKHNNNQQYLEYYNGKITTYGFQEANQDRYLLFFYVGEASEELPPAEPVARPVGKLSVPTEKAIIESATGWQMSSFSSWGPTPVLTLKPQISGIGGNVNSASFNTTNGYEVMSGTSMATPNVSGLMALVSEYIDQNLTGETAEKENPFVDVTENDWFEAAVLWAVSQDPAITNGTDETHFSPAKVCTRAEVVQFLYNAAGKPEVANKENPFTDVKESDWYYTAVLWAVENKITSGTTATTFAPAKKCSRAEIVQFLWNAAGNPEPEAVENPFEDVKESDWYAKAVAWAVSEGITSGTTPTTFAPTKSCSRAEVVQFLYKAAGGNGGAALTKVERAELAEKLAQSSALILTDEYGDPYSPRKQGAGLANMSLLGAASAYITEPIQNLYDNADGEFEFTFTVKDLYGEGVSYQLTPMVQSDYPTQADLDKDGEAETFNTLSTLTLATQEYEVEGTTYPADVEVEAPTTVEVPAGGEVEVTVKIKLTDETKAFLDALYPNGSYIEGFIVLDRYEEDTESDGQYLAEEIHATYMGFYGDWTKAPILEEHDWREIVDLETWLNTTEADEDGNTYADYGYTYLDVADFQVNTDVNLAYALNYMYLAQLGRLYGGYAGDNLYDYAEFNEKHIAISPEGITDTLFMMPYNIRNVRHLIMVVTNAETDEIYYVDDTEYLPKVAYDAENGYWANTGSFIFDGTDAEGKILPNGTKVNITYYANLMYGEDEIGTIIGEEKDYTKLVKDGEKFTQWQFACDIDTEAPVISSAEVDKEARTVTVTAKDNKYVAAIIMTDATGENMLDLASFSEDEEGKEVTATFDIPEGVPVVKFYVEDYATNEGESDVTAIDELTYVTINFSHPEGTELTAYEDEYVAYVGEVLKLPAVKGTTEQGEFIAWNTVEVPEIVNYETYDTNYPDTLFGFDDDEVTVTEDMDGITLYALYEIPGELGDPSDEAVAVWADQADWTGAWAMAGYNWEEEEPDRYFFNSEGSGTVLELGIDWDLLSYALFEAPDTVLFEVKATEDGAYTIQSRATGKYLTVKDGAIAFVDAPEATDAWTIEYVDDDETTYVTWVGDESTTLVFDMNEYAYKLLPLADVDSMSQWIIFYGGVATEYFYTTNPNGAETPDPDSDPDPDPDESFVLATELKDGDKVVIYNPAAGMAVSNADLSAEQPTYRAGVAVTPADGAIADPDDAIVWTVEVTGGGVILKDAEGKKLSMDAKGLELDKTNDVWEIRVLNDGKTVAIVNVNAAPGGSGDPKALEWYSKYSEFSTHYLNTTDAQFIFELYVLAAE